jgi:hypothetical protein
MKVCTHARDVVSLLGVFLLALFSFLRSFLLGHWFLFRTFSHTQLDHHVKVVEARNEAFGTPS